jgi:hypothetical protein
LWRTTTQFKLVETLKYIQQVKYFGGLEEEISTFLAATTEQGGE